MTAGYYLYCIAEATPPPVSGGANEPTSMGVIGLDSSPVMTVPFEDLAAVVHQVAIVPSFETESKSLAWLQSHQRVVEAAWEQFHTVLPFAFGTIIRGDQNHLLEWMKKERERLSRGLSKVRGKAEFGVQIFWHPQQCMERLLISNQELKDLKQKSEGGKPGAAYLYQSRFEKTLKEELEYQATRLFRTFFGQLKEVVAEIVVGKIKNGEGEKQILLNVSCLADKNQEKKLGNLLEEINQKEGHSVRFTGPWPPYSFVGT